MAYQRTAALIAAVKLDIFTAIGAETVSLHDLAARTSASGKMYIDYKDTESLKKMVSGNGKILSRKRTSASAMEQRMIARAVKRARYMALLPYVTTGL